MYKYNKRVSKHYFYLIIVIILAIELGWAFAVWANRNYKPVEFNNTVFCSEMQACK